MNPREYLTVALFASSLYLVALSPVEVDSLSAQAQRAYAAGDHDRALVLFDSVNTHFTSAALLYNLGNCYFRTGDIARAILYYERAHRLAPGDEDILANRELAMQQTKDRVNALPALGPSVYFDQLLAGDDKDQWARRSLWSMALLTILLSGGLLIRQPALRRGLRIAAVIAGVATVVSIGAASVRHAQLTDRSGAIIMVAKTDVRSEPREAATILFVLHRGTKVTVVQENGTWAEVRLTNGSVGWMPIGGLERI